MKTMELINEGYLTDMIEQIVKKVSPKVEEDLTGRTIDINEFRKLYCGGKSASWVRTMIFDEYPETDFENGGWVLNPHKNGVKTIIFAKPASKWMAEHDREIDWNEKIKETQK